MNRNRYHQKSDEELMLLVAARDREAFSVLYDRYAKEMVNFFFRRLGQDEERAQDFLHDLFLKVLDNFASFRPGKAFRPWLYAIALNMCRNEYRSMKVREDYRISKQAMAEAAGVAGPEKIDLDRFEQELAAKLNLLGDAHREVFLLRFQQELSISEIAELMEIPEGTVKSRLWYTLRTLSEQLSVFNPLIN
jgi:RNA polymerase sigma-70 factor (ECF subfamily)